MHRYDSIIASHKDRKHPGVMVKVPDCWGRDMGSIPGQISELFCEFCFVEFV